MVCAIQLSSDTATPVNELLATIGVGTHFNFSNTPYTERYEEVRTKLLALGIHQVRDSLNSHILDLADHGIRTMVVAESAPGGPEAFQRQIVALNAGRPPGKLAVDAIEGPNEPDQFWSRLGLSFEGQGFPDGVVAFQRKLFSALKRDPRTRDLPLIGPALGPAAAPGAPPIPALAELRHYVDWGGFHPYPYGGDSTGADYPYGGLRSFERHGTHPSVTLAQDGSVWRFYRTMYGDRPAAATETGYPTDKAHTSEALQARYLPRLYAEYFARGIRRTYIYQLVDTELDPKREDPEQSFGLLRADLSERPAYTALAEFTGLLRGDRTGCDQAKPGHDVADLGLDLSVQGTNAYPDTTRLKHLFLRQNQGRLLLLLWHEVSGEDASTNPRATLDVSPMLVTLRPSRPIRTVLHRLAEPSRIPGSGSDQNPALLEISVPDALTILEICS